MSEMLKGDETPFESGDFHEHEPEFTRHYFARRDSFV